MKTGITLLLLPIVLVFGLCLAACNSTGSRSAATNNGSTQLSEDEKHRLYTAALAASDLPLESDSFRNVCKTIGIFNAGGTPNDSYLPFVSAHVDWAMKAQTDQFKQEIRTREKAREYVSKHLPTTYQ